MEKNNQLIALHSSEMKVNGVISCKIHFFMSGLNKLCSNFIHIWTNNTVFVSR